MQTPSTSPVSEPPGERRFLLVFVDGIGVDTANDANPFKSGAMPFLESLLGAPLNSEGITRAKLNTASIDDLFVGEIDACLGVEGLPQSATGQTTLFTGVNAAKEVGRHVTAFPGRQLKILLNEHSVFKQFSALGYDATFANTFTDRYDELLAARRIRKSASVVAAEAGALPLRRTEDHLRGEGLTWDIEGDLFARGQPETSIGGFEMTGVEAGKRLSLLACRHHFTLFETFLPDLSGHLRLELPPHEILRRIDDLLRGVVSTMSADLTVLMTSDHGNFETTLHGRHTRNPVPFVAIGAASNSFSKVSSLSDVVPRLIESVTRNRR